MNFCKSFLFYQIAIALCCVTTLIASSVPKTTKLRVKRQQPGRTAIETLDDIEALAFFVLNRKYQFTSLYKDDSASPDAERSAANETLDERTLLDLLVKLKFGNLIDKSSKKSPNDTVSCTVLQETYTNLLKQGSRQTIQSSQHLETLCEAASTCQTAADLIDLIVDSSSGRDITKPTLSLNQAIVRLCPVMLFQLNDDECGTSRQDRVLSKLRPSAGAVWGFALLFVTIISFCSLVGVALMPFLDKQSFLVVLNVCEGLAVGSLVGSAIFHLIPQAFDLLAQDGNTHHEYLWKALIIFGGIYLFYWSERIMKIMVDYRRKKKLKEFALPSITEVSEANREANERHVSFTEGSNGVAVTAADTLSPTANQKLLASNGSTGLDGDGDVKFSGDYPHDGSRSSSFTHHHSHGHDHGVAPGESAIATVAWMIIFGDGLHNFIDGLSIGAAFSESILAGISISVAVVCEEFPHELGDFAVLIASGMTMRQAIGYNFLSACTCYIGMICGILLGDFTEGSTYILALAGGMFLYIALVDMMG